MTPRLSDLLARLQPVVREEMLKVCVPNCCIATVAVLCRVFRHHGFEPHGLPVSVVIRNPKFVKLMADGVPLPDEGEATTRWFKATGAYSIGIVPESALESAARGYPGFGGHLLCRVQNVIVDASLDAANRPQHHILLPPFHAVETSPRFLRGEGMLVGKINGCEVQYRPLRDQTWRSAPDWKDERRFRDTVNAILRRSAAHCGGT